MSLQGGTLSSKAEAATGGRLLLKGRAGQGRASRASTRARIRSRPSSIPVRSAAIPSLTASIRCEAGLRRFGDGLLGPGFDVLPICSGCSCRILHPPARERIDAS